MSDFDKLLDLRKELCDIELELEDIVNRGLEILSDASHYHLNVVGEKIDSLEHIVSRAQIKLDQNRQNQIEVNELISKYLKNGQPNTSD